MVFSDEICTELNKIIDLIQDITIISYYVIFVPHLLIEKKIIFSI
jgi:hypothetical protein